jgi:hypothetical protein
MMVDQFPRRLKLRFDLVGPCGSAEAVPFQNRFGIKSSN